MTKRFGEGYVFPFLTVLERSAVIDLGDGVEDMDLILFIDGERVEFKLGEVKVFIEFKYGGNERRNTFFLFERNIL